MALPDPAGFVLAAAVLQVEDGVALLLIGVVAGRRVHHDVARLPRHLGLVPARADLAVGHVLGVVEIHALLGDLDPARRLAGAEEGVAAGVVDLDAVHDERVVVEAGDDRRRGHRPDAVVAAFHVPGPARCPARNW